MKLKILFIIIFFWISLGFAQREFHVTTDGTSSGTGTISKPWDLQTALNISKSKLRAGDIVWLHNGIYNGRFHSNIFSDDQKNKIVVSSFPGEWAIINANVNSQANAALTVTGANVIYQNFEIAPNNISTRDERVEGFRRFDGIFHTDGENCEFYNLKIHGNNGLGFGSWKKTAGSIISNCIIYDNGYINLKGRGIGEGMYVQNESNAERIIRDNIIFNNYYKGIEVWSASKNADFEYVKNISIINNVIFNSGLVANRTVDNIIVATDDRNGVNIAKNIKVNDNILYHNTDYAKNEVNGDAPSLTLGYRNSAAIENIEVKNNLILGRNNPVRLLYAKSLNFENNTVYGGYIHIMPINFTRDGGADFKFNNNTYFTKNSTPVLLIKEKKFGFEEWRNTFKLDNGSRWSKTSNFEVPQILDITKNTHKKNEYRVVLLNKNPNEIHIDFTEFDIEQGTSYTVRDVENLERILKSGKLDKSSSLKIPMQPNLRDKEESNNLNKSLSNFGVYVVEFKS